MCRVLVSELPSCSLNWGCTPCSGESVLNLRGGSVGGVGTRKMRVLRLVQAGVSH